MWLGTLWIPHSGLPLNGSVRNCFWYHRSAVGHAVGQDVVTDITWHGDRAAHFVANSMSQGAVLVDAQGVVRMPCLEVLIMAYQPPNLSALAYANGFTLWHYRTSDLAAEVDNAGYFNPASRMLRAGDFVMVNAGLGATPVHGLMVVVGNSDGAVDLSNLTAFGAANAD